MIWLVGLLSAWVVLSWLSAWLVLHPYTRPVRLPPDLGAGTPEDAAFTSADGTPLSGWWFTAPEPRGSVVLCHGAFESRMGVVDCVPHLRGAGWNVLSFDFRARGLSGGSGSTLGRLETDDALAAVAWVLTRPEAHELPLVLMGFSQGAAASLLAAAREPRVAAVVSDSAFASLDRAEGRHLRTFLGPFAGPLGVLTRWFSRRMVGYDPATLRPVDAIGRIAPRPVLLIHGTRDWMIDLADCHLLFEASHGCAEQYIVEHARHTKARRLVPDEYWQRVLGFLVHIR